MCTVRLTLCYYHVTYEFQTESTLYICLNVKETNAREALERLSRQTRYLKFRQLQEDSNIHRFSS